MTYKIVDIQGIGPEFVEKLKKFNVHTAEDLVRVVGDEKACRDLVEKTGISQTHLDKWAKMANLMRVHGIGPQYAELLFWSGVDTVEKLREQPVEALVRKLAEANATRKLTNALPNAMDVTKWVESVGRPEPVPTR